MWPDFLSLQVTKGERKINKFAFLSKEHRSDALELLQCDAPYRGHPTNIFYKLAN